MAIAGGCYFALVFVVAFVLGVVRTLWVAPAIGETWAVACEAPLLIAATFFAARFVIPRIRPPRTTPSLLGVGLVGLALQETAEIALIYAEGETLEQQARYLTTPAGLIYLAALAVFVLAPLIIWRARPY